MRWLGVLGFACALLAGCGETDTTSPERSSSGDDVDTLYADHAGAYNACKDFVKRQLRAPGTAQFPDYFDADGEVAVSRNGDTYVVVSHVDADNAFGALLQNEFVCEIRDEGEQWRAVNVEVIE